ncbi:MAG: hypothetical protein K2X69_03440, partial [Silvanigrellaceae bacterium]|nr:hypothetical protein [Silvanigrellaceae bacterium]
SLLGFKRNSWRFCSGIYGWFDSDYAILVINQINLLIKYTENEKNLKNFLDEEFQLEVSPQGFGFNSCTEFLENIRDKITQHLLENGFCLNEIKEKIT